ncbi:hypothetical protein INS90_01990 [Trueperella pecoris]|uniref:RAMA domain-containing protein n=1 Tax=Trueperella pecoris TaxID=2733571 RepID=A0A7M1R1T0_9ACTO|nr:hypothetical protein [Trueperella pecoris]QOR48091.1 hypothetical protein INS90_01990 [Trueperella pecoris]
MGVFALRNGRLVAAPQSVVTQITDEVLNAVRAQSLEFIDRPLFPVGWAEESQSLLALDPTGQVVTIDVLEALSSDAFVSALTRAGRHGEMNRLTLANMYTGGESAFDADYQRFVESSPPLTKRGPRLFIFAFDYDVDVRRPISALRHVGVEAYRVVVHEGVSGLLVEIADVMENRGVIEGGSQPVAIDVAEATDVAGVADPAEGRVARPEDGTAGSEEGVSGPADFADPEPETVEMEAISTPVVFAEAEPVAEAETAPEVQAEPDREPAATNAPAAEVAVVAEAAAVAEPEPARAATDFPAEDETAVIDRAQRYDAAWEIIGWQYEKERPAKRDASDVLGSVERRRADKVARQAQHDDMWARLEKNRKDVGVTMYDLLKAESKRAEQRLWDMSAPKAENNAQIFSERFSSEVSSEAVADAALKSDRWDERSAAVSDPSPIVPTPRRVEPEATAVPEARAEHRAEPHPEPSLEPHPEPSLESRLEPRTDLRTDRTAAEQPRSEAAPIPDPRMQRIVAEIGVAKLTWRSRRKHRALHGYLTSSGLIDIIGVGTFADPSEAAATASGNPYADGWHLWQVPDGRTLGDFA